MKTEISNELFTMLYFGTLDAQDDENGFSHDEFWQTMREWSADNCVLISEQNAPDDFDCIWEKSVLRSVNATGKSRATEKLFVYSKGKAEVK